MGHFWKNKRLFRIGLFLLTIFVVGGIGGIFFERYVLPRVRTNSVLSKLDLFRRVGENITVINKTEQVTVMEDDSVNKIASRAANSVVNILSVKEVQGQAVIKQSKTEVSLERENMSGTGIFVTSDGLVVTYRGAIIEDGAKYTVLASNGSAYEAQLVGIDRFSNLAYLKINATNLQAISFADSANIFPGKKLLAIGNSFGEYQNRFSAGLLSNVNKVFNLDGKTVSSTEKLEGVFETDFNDQREYLGGPVINYNGELVGIIGSLAIDNQHKYFQIPSNVVRDSMNLAIGGSLDARPVLGAYYVPITKEYSLVHGLDRDRGALVYSASGKQGLAIIADSASEKAGLKLNDIIIAVNGQEINLSNPLSNALSNYKKGDQISLLVLRDGLEIKIPVQL